METENTEIILGGDFNADIREGENDVLWKKLRDVMINELRMSMLVQGHTHQEARQGMLCKERQIDHIYTNINRKSSKEHAETKPGLSHKLINTIVKKSLKMMRIRQQRERTKKK